VYVVDVEIKDDVGQSTLVARVVKNVVYSCQAANEAGLSGVESCTVTAVKPATRACHVTLLYAKRPSLSRLYSTSLGVALWV